MTHNCQKAQGATSTNGITVNELNGTNCQKGSSIVAQN